MPALRKAFRDGLDIHAMTASEMFGVPVKDMPGEVRRRAKAINFGIIYGISAFGLANQLAIPREEAGAYIKKYFERFPGIRDYMEETKAFAKKNGYVLTLFGRKCHYPDITAANPSLRAFNERAAINARLQGSAADIIRRAMVRIEPALAQAKLNAKMLLQVHDELIFEVPEGEVEKTLPIVKRVMEDAPMPALSLSVPLQVDARAAHNWDEAHFTAPARSLRSSRSRLRYHSRLIACGVRTARCSSTQAGRASLRRRCRHCAGPDASTWCPADVVSTGLGAAAGDDEVGIRRLCAIRDDVSLAAFFAASPILLASAWPPPS